MKFSLPVHLSRGLDESKLSFIHSQRDFSRASSCAFAMNSEALDSPPNVGQAKCFAKMKQEDPEMIEALEEDLRDFHGRIEKSSTWWCPGLQGTTTSARKKVLTD